MSSVWALQDAKSKFSAVVDRAISVEPQVVTRRGTPVAVLVSYALYEEVAHKSGLRPLDLLLGGPKIEGGIPVNRARGLLKTVEFA